MFELKFAKMPEEPAQADPTPPPSVSGTVKSEEVERSILTSDEESDDQDDGTMSEEEREKRIKELQQLVGKKDFFFGENLFVILTTFDLQFLKVGRGTRSAFHNYLWSWDGGRLYGNASC